MCIINNCYDLLLFFTEEMRLLKERLFMLESQLMQQQQPQQTPPASQQSTIVNRVTTPESLMTSKRSVQLQKSEKRKTASSPVVTQSTNTGGSLTEVDIFASAASTSASQPSSNQKTRLDRHHDSDSDWESIDGDY
jgi:hypothetical protein